MLSSSDAEQLLLGRGELRVVQRAVLMQRGELLELLGDRRVRLTALLGPGVWAATLLVAALLLQAADPGILACLLGGLVRRALGHLLARHVRATADHSRAEQRAPPPEHVCLLYLTLAGSDVLARGQREPEGDHDLGG